MNPPQPAPASPATDREPVLFIHDGGVDDYIALALLLSMPHIDIRAIVVTPADCYIKPAVSATRKILDLAGRWDIPVAESTVRGLNPFPRLFRRDSFTVDHLPVLNERDEIRTPLIAEPGQAFIARLLSGVDPAQPWTVLETGPLTTLAAALDQSPGIDSRIREIIWMGGALDVRRGVKVRLAHPERDDVAALGLQLARPRPGAQGDRGLDALHAPGQPHYFATPSGGGANLSRSACATHGGTMDDTSPPNCATSLTSDELT